MKGKVVVALGQSVGRAELVKAADSKVAADRFGAMLMAETFRRP